MLLAAESRFTRLGFHIGHRPFEFVIDSRKVKLVMHGEVLPDDVPYWT